MDEPDARDVVAEALFRPHQGGKMPSAAYVSEEGDLLTALKYTYLFWPKLVEVEGAVIIVLDGNVYDEVIGRLAQRGDSSSSWTDAVDSFNWFELCYLFRQWYDLGDWHMDTSRELGQVLVRAWRARLLEAYPDREFLVRLLEPTDDWDPRIEVVQVAPPLLTPDSWRAAS
ncbi:hypothetical protein [Actinokineospora terrae]|uniref:Uncharacterized protein n=1 Tax=Actinokineospora terrae TaxID=155974 RepID=A0A1H9MQ42_9PSEU|nr:hypothetical protein [Actinokineospora terrae]SER25607.1 hypothetical protein SAMN04487818_102268 [Actinokineospora terrae]